VISRSQPSLGSQTPKALSKALQHDTRRLRMEVTAKLVSERVLRDRWATEGMAFRRRLIGNDSSRNACSFAFGAEHFDNARHTVGFFSVVANFGAPGPMAAP
jgi:hypothetical protein